MLAKDEWLNPWSIPRIWPDSTVFIIGGGPSVLEQDLSLIHKHRVIGVNQAFKLGPWVDVCWYGDKDGYDSNIPAICEYGGLIVTCSRVSPHQRKAFIKYVARGPKSGLNLKQRTHVGWNNNSGASAINLAYWLGAKTVVLLGFQMEQASRGERTHWHDDYTHRKKSDGSYVDPYYKFNRHWPDIKRDADKAGFRIINATIGGALEIFERMSLEEACRIAECQ